MALRALFFDAGNTLVFADPAKTLAPLAALGILPSEAQLYAAERAARKQFDAARTKDPVDRSVAGSLELSLRAPAVDGQFWDIYYGHLLRDLNQNDTGGLCAALSQATRQSAHWNRVLPGTRQILDRLAQDYALGIISNSDGHIFELLQSVGLGDCFRSVTDSAVVGFEKPDVRIFQSALQSLGASPGESMFVGDVYSVDYLGARNAGMTAVLMDRAGAYRESGLTRVESLEELETMLGNSSRH